MKRLSAGRKAYLIVGTVVIVACVSVGLWGYSHYEVLSFEWSVCDAVVTWPPLVVIGLAFVLFPTKKASK